MLDHLLEEVDAFSSRLKDGSGAFEYEVLAPSEPFKHWRHNWREVLFHADSALAPEVIDRFGVYLLATPDLEIFYIGKASRSSAAEIREARPNYYLGAEIWKKIGAAGDGLLARKANLSAELRRAIEEFDISIVAIDIRPHQLAACVETYLQAICVLQDGKLPEANAQIG